MDRKDKLILWWHTLLPRLHCQGSTGPCKNRKAKWVHRGCAYPDPLANVAYLCEECAEEEWAHWNEMWADYNSTRF